jgi:uncharacterized protein YjiS (DUF1127 family)
MSTLQLKSYSMSAGRWRWRAAGAAWRRMAAVFALWRSGPAARRRVHVPGYMDDRLLADIGLTRHDLGLPTRAFIYWS